MCSFQVFIYQPVFHNTNEMDVDLLFALHIILTYVNLQFYKIIQ